MPNNVISLAEKVQSSFAWDIQQMLQNALDDPKLAAGEYNAGMVILLDNRDGKYTIQEWMAQLKSSECVALLECTKAQRMEEMGFGSTSYKG